jgi:hypothetical protein
MRAMQLAEGTGIILGKRIPSEQFTLHLVHPNGQGSLCGDVSIQDALGVSKHMRPLAGFERACTLCALRSSKAYGEKVTIEQMVDDFNKFIGAMPTKG